MASIEQRDGSDNPIPGEIEKVARFLLGQIKREDMDPGSQSILNFYLGLLSEDSDFKQAVYARKNEIILNQKDGRKIPLFSDEELASAKKNRSKKYVGLGKPVQMSMFGDLHLEDSSENIIIIDPENKINSLHKNQQNRFLWNKNKAINEEIKYNRKKLRDLLGLPVARGKSEYVNNKFYKFLVRRIVNFDTFGVFNEYDRVTSEIPPELEQKIGEVRDLVAELLSGLLNTREKFQRFDSFTREYTDKWGQ